MRGEQQPILHRLREVIESRKTVRPSNSYVVELLDGGESAICTKIVEEAYEVVSAAAEFEVGQPDQLIHELADLYFHLLVLMGWAGLSSSQVEAELERRFGVSGIQEKINRTEPDT